MSATAIRGKDWIFSAFWAACGVTSNAPKCYVNIPITVLFKDGKPMKALNTNHEGIVRRVDLEQVHIDRNDFERGLRGESLKLFRAVRQVLIEFGLNTGYSKLQYDRDEEPIICNVFYIDNESEEMTLNTLDILVRNEQWRKQILLIQGYVPRKSLQTGNYSHAPQVKSKLDVGNEAADNFTRAIAKYAERAYLVSSSELLDEDNGSKSISLRVQTMQSKFALDHMDKIVFLYCEYTAVEIENSRKQVEEYMMKEKESRQDSAAISVSNELLSLLVHARNRGLTLEQAFAHFDVSNSGYIDADMLIDGLAKLGIGVTYPVAEAVLQIIGGMGSAFVSINEFANYFLSPPDVELFNSITEEDKGSKAGRRGGSTDPKGMQGAVASSKASSRKPNSDLAVKQTKTHGKGKVVNSQLLPPPKDNLSINKDFMNIEASQAHEYDWEQLGGNDDDVSVLLGTEEGSMSNTIRSELPLPLSAYEKALHGSDRSASSRRSLPTWAAKRSHRALKQLDRAHQQIKKNRNQPLSEAFSSMREDSSTISTMNDNSITGQSTHTSTTKAPPSQVTPLSLSGIVHEMNDDELYRSKDELLHVDRGVIMSYRLINGLGYEKDKMKTHEKSDALRYRSILEERQKHMASSDGDSSGGDGSGAESSVHHSAGDGDGVSPNDNGGSTAESKGEADHTDDKESIRSSFTLVFIPDLFMTLDTLQSHYESLLLKYPYAQLLLIGLPGLPSTVWPNNWVLNSDLQSRAIAKLVQHLVSTQRIHQSSWSEAPIFFLGFGTGVYTLSRFVAKFLPNIPEVNKRTRAICMINGLLRYNKKFRNICRDLRQSMMTSNAHEVNELIASVHFYDEYLSLNGREQVLHKFWESRHGLQIDQAHDVKNSINNNNAKNDHQYSSQQQQQKQQQLGFYGVLEQMKGILISLDDFDGAEILMNTDIPIVVIQSTEDVFVDPKNAALFSPDNLPPTRNLVHDISDALDANAVHVCWLRSGHEAIQERSSFLLGFISQLVQLCGIHASSAPPVAAVNNASGSENSVTESNSESIDEILDVLNLGGGSNGTTTKHDHSSSMRADDDLSVVSATTVTPSSASNNRRSETANRKVEATNEEKRQSDEINREMKLQEEQELAFAKEQRQYAKEQQAADKLRRSQIAADRKKRDLKAARDTELQYLYQREQEEAEQKAESKELQKMSKEDRRSKFAAEYYIECQIAENSAILAKERAITLAAYRKEEAIKKVEEAIARKRAERIEQRRQKAIALVKSIQDEELVLSGEQEGGYDAQEEDPAKVVTKMIDASCRLMRDLLECRQKAIESLKRQKLVEEKTQLFYSQLNIVDNDERRLRRAIRMIEVNPSIVGEDINHEVQLAELRRSLAAKQESLVELTAISTQRQAQLDAANRSAQLLKVATQERDKLMSQRVKELYDLEMQLNKKISTLKIEKERLSVKRDRCRLQIFNHQRRVAKVEKELIRVRQHKGKLIDTDVWVEGVVQRCVTKELKQHLKSELKVARHARDEVVTELGILRSDIFNIIETISRLKRDMNKMTNVSKVLFKRYKQFTEVTIKDVMENLNTMQNNADRKETLKKRNMEVEKIFAGIDSKGALDKIRYKESDLRTKDERKFVGMDMVLHPEAYLHITIVEAEQMQFDEDYQCELSKSDLERIIKLPDQVSLALPFLHTQTEIAAHRLLTTFLKGKDEQYFKDKDYYGHQLLLQSSNLSTVDDDQSSQLTDDISLLYSNSQSISKSALEAAEVVHDLLVRESLRDRLRAVADDEYLTEEEQKWIIMDKVLSPHVYDVKELEAMHTIRTVARTVDNTLSTSVSYAKKNKNKRGRSVEGDKYDDMRSRFQAGEDVFHYNWDCPFSREQLLQLRNVPARQLQSEEEIFARSMLDKYFVDDKESVLGHATLRAVDQLTSNIARIVRTHDDEQRQAVKSMQQVNESEQREQMALMNGEDIDLNNNANSLASVTKSDESISRLWGSWSEVHPASAGKESQIAFFQPPTFDPKRDHPASFALPSRPEEDQVLSDDDNGDSLLGLDKAMKQDAPLSEAKIVDIGLDLLTGQKSVNRSNNQQQQRSRKLNSSSSSSVYIAGNISELSRCVPRTVRGKVILLVNETPMVIYETKNESLQARQSRSHYFNVMDQSEYRVLELTVSIVFKGDFTGNGYKLGRLAGGLFRLPDEKTTSSSLPEPVGYAPYPLQSPNLPDSLGRLIILHKPKTTPIPAGTFQIVIGCASNTKYSIEVSGKVARLALPVIDLEVTKAREMQHRLPVLLVEIDSVQESIRLAERKLMVCEKMIQEAELESARAHKGIRICRKKIEKDDEDFLLLEDERRALIRECGIFEIEYAQWANAFATRCKEKDDIKEGIKSMYQYKRDKLKEKDNIKSSLETYRKELPPCMNVVRNTVEAVNLAAVLNTTLEGISEEASLATTGYFGSLQVSTPADDVRRQFKQNGFKSLTLEEQQWCVLDEALNPSKYEWLREKEEEENLAREAAGKAPKTRKFNAAVEEFRLKKSEIEYILETPFSMLSRREMIIRKLLIKYHDDASLLKKEMSAVAYSFDPHLAERTRVKDPASYSKEELAWSTIDRVLHPEIWAYFVNRSENPMDRHNKESQLSNIQKKKKTTKKTKSGKVVDGANAEIDDAINKSAGGASNVNSMGNISTKNDTSKESSLLANLMDETYNANDDKNNDNNNDNNNNNNNNNRSSAEESRKDENDLKKKNSMKKSDVFLSGWKCPFNREEILRIWRTPRHFLTTDEERDIFKLLHKFNGTYSSYMDLTTQVNRKTGHGNHQGKHIQWDKTGSKVTKDVDYRARQLLREIDRATYTKNEWMSSDVLHANVQKFPTRVLRMQLEETLDNVLIEQIRDRERAEKMRVDHSDSDSDHESDRDANNLEVEDSDDNDADLMMASVGITDPEIMNKIQKRAKRREKRKLKLKKLTEKEEVLKVKKILSKKKKSGDDLAEAILLNQLGVDGCLACRARRCKWSPSVDENICRERINALDTEIQRIRLDRDSSVFESEVCLSAQLGGTKIFRRIPLLEELHDEKREIEQRLDLNSVDKELHDAYNTRKEYFESKFLHGYSIMLWTNNARLALEARQSRLSAQSVAKEVVDDILDWMLEGWYFGERESQFKVLGHVPSIKPKGKIKAGQDQIMSVSHVVAKMKERAENRRKSIKTAQNSQGQMIEKAMEIESNAQNNLQKIKVARDGNLHEHLLDETENTLKFGIFMITLMYFRAMTFLKREQRSWAGDDDAVGVKDKNRSDKVMTDERMRMIDEENRAMARKKKIDIVLARSKIGEQRRAEREAAERKEAISRMQAIVRRQRLELNSVSIIQRIYRGHIGRKAAWRWALKRAELGAMNALLNSTAIAIQRIYRGYAARVYTIRKREEMAYFIALMRLQEAQQDEEIYWQTHPWSRFKKSQKEWLDANLSKYRNREVLGGARLTMEEQALAEGKTLEQIKRELEGRADEDGDDDEEEVEEKPSANTQSSSRTRRTGGDIDEDDVNDDDD